MKKILLYSLLVLLLTITIAGSTFAYLTASGGSGENALETDSHKFEVIYTGGDALTGELKLTDDETEGKNTTVNIRMSNDSVLGVANLYINIENITENIATEALRWKVYKTYDGKTEEVREGTFADCETNSVKRACVTGDKLYIVTDYQLSTNNTAFTVYIWLDGNIATKNVIGGKFSGYIGAETDSFTADIG